MLSVIRYKILGLHLRNLGGPKSWKFNPISDNLWLWLQTS